MKNIKKLLEGTLVYRKIEFGNSSKAKQDKEINRYMIW
jgi:hypothetical protein